MRSVISLHVVKLEQWKKKEAGRIQIPKSLLLWKTTSRLLPSAYPKSWMLFHLMYLITASFGMVPRTIGSDHALHHICCFIIPFPLPPSLCAWSLLIIILILLSYSISNDPGLIHRRKKKKPKRLNNYYKNKKIINKLNLGKLNSNKIATCWVSFMC